VRLRVVWWEHQREHPPAFGSFEHDQPARPEPDHGAVRVAGQERTGKPVEVRKMTDEHEVVHLRVEALDPGRRVVVRSEVVALLDVGAQQLTPHLGGLTGPGLARVDNPGRPHPELVERPTSHPRNALGALVGERPFRVFILGRGLPVLNEEQLHGHPR
jgi:hypothetical protein